MRWKCFKVASIRYTDWVVDPEDNSRTRECLYTLPDGREVNFDDLPVGAMFHTTQMPEGYHSARPSIVVCLPGKVLWHMNDKGSDGCLWTITGEIPNITAHPSINYVGTYHGWVQNGFVSDDVDGRKFGDAGRLAT